MSKMNFGKIALASLLTLAGAAAAVYAARNPEKVKKMAGTVKDRVAPIGASIASAARTVSDTMIEPALTTRRRDLNGADRPRADA